MSYFEDCVQLIFELEGGYVYNVNDPGGETKYGITKRSYPHLNIKKITKLQAEKIYEIDYWDKCRCAELPDFIRLPVFDCAVNQGPYYAITALQKILNIKQDGIIGPITIAKSYEEGKNLIEKYMCERALRYINNRNFRLFGKTWMRRIFFITYHC